MNNLNNFDILLKVRLDFLNTGGGNVKVKSIANAVYTSDDGFPETSDEFFYIGDLHFSNVPEGTKLEIDTGGYGTVILVEQNLAATGSPNASFYGIGFKNLVTSGSNCLFIGKQIQFSTITGVLKVSTDKADTSIDTVTSPINSGLTLPVSNSETVGVWKFLNTDSKKYKFRITAVESGEVVVKINGDIVTTEPYNVGTNDFDISGSPQPINGDEILIECLDTP